MRHPDDLVLPGPTPMHEAVRAALSDQLVHHESDEFRDLFAQTLQRVRQFMGTETEPILTSGSTSSALTQTLMNLTAPGEDVIMAVGGYFAERWARAGDALGRRVRRVVVPDGQAVSADELDAAMVRWPGARLVCVVHCETSTGAMADIESLAEAVHARGRMFAVDAATSAGVREVRVDQWGLDVVVVGIQKALGCPPGLAFTTVSDRAFEGRTRGCPDDLEWGNLRSHQVGNGFYTPAILQWRSLHAALGVIEQEGLEAHQTATAARAQLTRDWARERGVALVSPDEESAASLTVLHWPHAGRAQAWVREHAHARIALGIGSARQERLRIGHLGWTSDEATQRVFDALDALHARTRAGRHAQRVS